MSFSRKLLSFTGLFALGISLAHAQALPRSIADCAAQTPDATRLACFDREVAKLTQSTKSVAPTQVVPAQPAAPPPTVVTTPLQNAASKEDEFGLSGSLARKRSEKKKEADTAPQELHARVSSIKEKPYGELILELDNGQVWEQPEKKLSFLIKVGEGVVITQHKLGSFFLTADSGATTRIRRVR
ncbi:MAG: hypothetical protein WDO56_27430 [Gammaproteobacteria bacterium]